MPAISMAVCIIPNFEQKSTKKGQKSTFFGRTFPIEIRTLSRIISLKCADFLVLTPACGCAGAHPGGRPPLDVEGTIDKGAGGNCGFWVFYSWRFGRKIAEVENGCVKTGGRASAPFTKGL